MIRACVITLSDKGSKGQREDLSGPAVAEALRGIGCEVIGSEVLPDDKETLKERLVYHSDRADLIITTGGTGLSPRDVTPEATLEVIDRQIPGIAEAMRAEGLKKTPRAMLSRAVSGARGGALIINLPGSPRAAIESLEAVLEIIPHAIEKIKGVGQDCAR